MKKIAIIGCGGAGKSTFSRKLGKLLNIEVLHLDTFYWKSGWVAPPDEEWNQTHEELLQRESWLMEGNFGGTMEKRIAAADTIFFLDMPRRLCLYRVLKRRIQYHGRTRPDLPDGCLETFDWEFLKWIWSYPKRRPKILKTLATQATSKQVFIFRSPREVESYIKRLEETTQRLLLC